MNTTYFRPCIRPATDILENDGGFLILVNMPGVEFQNIRIEKQDRKLLVQAESYFDMSNDNKKIRMEFGDVEYFLELVFADDFEREHMDAKLQDGLLRIFIEKKINTKIQ